MKWQIPLFDLKLNRYEIAEVARALKRGWLSEGEKTFEFERALEKFLGCGHVVATSSNTAALYLALLALGIRPNDKVIVPSLSFVACANVVVRLGASPVFADIVSIDRPVIDPSEVERLAKNAHFVMPMHYGGYPAPIKEICEIAKSRKLFVVEDAAHALGASIEGRALGTFGDVGCYSFYANKNLGIGEGGAVWCGDGELAAKIRALKNHGLTRSTWERHVKDPAEYDVIDAGMNFRIDEIRAALGVALVKRFKTRQARRERIVKRYVKNLSQVDGISMPFKEFSGKPAYHLFVVTFGNSKLRDQAKKMLSSRKVQTSLHYRPIHTFSFYARANLKLKKSEDFYERSLSLPLYPELSLSQVDQICEIIVYALKR